MKNKRGVLLLGVGLLLLVGLAGTAMAQIQPIDGKSNDPLHGVIQSIIKLPDSLDPEGATIAQEVKTLVAQWSASASKGGGWVHLVSNHDRDKDQVGTLPNGQPVLIDYIYDNWYQLDSEGKVLTAVTTQKDKDGQSQQIATLRDGIWRNLTLNTKFPNGESSTLQLDYGFGADVDTALSQGSKLSRQENVVDGRPTVLFAIHEDFSEPVYLAGYQKAVASARRTAAFDMETGQTLYLERIFTMIDGEQKVSRTDILVFEKALTPPAHVLEFLEQEVTQ